MPIKEVTTITIGNWRVVHRNRNLAEGEKIIADSSGFPVGFGVVKELVVKDDGLDGNAETYDDLRNKMIDLNSEAKTVPVRLESDQINRKGSQLYNQKDLGPIKILRTYHHVEDRS